MASYRQIQQGFAKLEKEAQKLRAAAIKIIPTIRKQIEKYGITAEELGFAASAKSVEPAESPIPAAQTGGKKGKAATKAKAAGKAKPDAKYQDPKSGATWSGMGKPPGWIRNAKNRDAFLISSVTAEAKSTEKAPKAKATAKPASKAAANKKSAAAVKKSAPTKKAAASKPKAATAPAAQKSVAKKVKAKSVLAKKAAPAVVPTTLDAGLPA